MALLPRNLSGGNSFPIPEDPLALELTVTENYARKHPENFGYFRGALSSVVEYAGTTTTNEEAIDLILREAEPGHDDMGTIIVGDTPKPVEDMIESIYRLTGATLRRNDRSDNDKGVVVRHGSYGGADVWFAEYFYTKNPYYGKQPTLRIKLEYPDAAERTLSEMSDADIRKYKRIMGITNTQEALDEIADWGLNHYNYLNYAKANRPRMAEGVFLYMGYLARRSRL